MHFVLYPLHSVIAESDARKLILGGAGGGTRASKPAGPLRSF